MPVPAGSASDPELRYVLWAWSCVWRKAALIFAALESMAPLLLTLGFYPLA